jgi:hypothetical protein
MSSFVARRTGLSAQATIVCVVVTAGQSWVYPTLPMRSGV